MCGLHGTQGPLQVSKHVNCPWHGCDSTNNDRQLSPNLLDVLCYCDAGINHSTNNQISCLFSNPAITSASLSLQKMSLQKMKMSLQKSAAKLLKLSS
jgi:hypothetical protein